MTLTGDLAATVRPRVQGDLPGPRSAELLARQARRESNARVYGRHLPIAVEAAAGSFVRDVEKREILFDLETARRDLFEREGKSGAFDLLSKCGTNLLRLWAED